jgi:hypothetical protein
MDKEDYYVYVCIDPRNLEEFYYGKGKISRKEVFLKFEGDSRKDPAKNKIIKETCKMR